VPVSYLDWLVAQGWLDPASFFGRMVRLHLGRLARGHPEHLGEEPFASRGFNPLDGLPGDWVQTYQGPATSNGKRPSGWSQRRPRAQADAEDEAINQGLGRQTAQLPLWGAGQVFRLRMPSPGTNIRRRKWDPGSVAPTRNRPHVFPLPPLAGSPAGGGTVRSFRRRKPRA
jgi:hypothetical protein